MYEELQLLNINYTVGFESKRAVFSLCFFYEDIKLALFEFQVKDLSKIHTVVIPDLWEKCKPNILENYQTLIPKESIN